MARYLSPEDVESEYLGALGPELGRIFHALHNELSWLHLKWEQYTELYGTKPERLDLLNEAAPVFFRVVQDALWEDTLMHLSRLTDPAQSPGKGNRRNLTINALPALVSDPALKAAIEERARSATEAAAFARDWRNRQLAHRDLALALREPVAPLAPASRLAVKQALEALRETLNEINTHFRGTTVVYEYSGHSGGAQSVLRKLKTGIAAWRAQSRRLESGAPLPEDIQPPPAI